MDLSFLNDIKLQAAPKAPKKQAVVKLPEDADIRVFANGSVYPSKAFATKANLEFVPKKVLVPGSDPEVVNNGMDIFTSDSWSMLPNKIEPPILFAYTLPKSMSKVNMWANTKYEDDKITPKASIFTQGTSVFSKTRLVVMLTEVYGIDWKKVAYVDLNMKTDIVIPSASGMYDIPSVKRVGKETVACTIRRQNISISPLVVAHTEYKLIPDTEDAAPELVVESMSAMPVTPENAHVVSPPVNANPLFNSEDVSAIETPAPTTTVDNPQGNAEDPGTDWAKDLGFGTV